MQITTTEGYPYPLGTDFAAIPVHQQAFALGFDASGPTWDAAFSAVTKTKCVIARTSADSSAISSGSGETFIPFNTLLFDNTGGSWSGGEFFPNPNDLPAWWLFGVYLYVVNGGTVTTNRVNQVTIQPGWSGYGQATIPGTQPAPVTTATYPTPTGAIYGESIETNNGGEPVQAQGIIRTFSSFAYISVFYGHNDDASGATRTVKAGSSFWGIRLGNA